MAVTSAGQNFQGENLGRILSFDLEKGQIDFALLGVVYDDLQKAKRDIEREAKREGKESRGSKESLQFALMRGWIFKYIFVNPDKCRERLSFQSFSETPIGKQFRSQLPLVETLHKLEKNNKIEIIPATDAFDLEADIVAFAVNRKSDWLTPIVIKRLSIGNQILEKSFVFTDIRENGDSAVEAALNAEMEKFRVKGFLPNTTSQDRISHESIAIFKKRVRDLHDHKYKDLIMIYQTNVNKHTSEIDSEDLPADFR